MKNLIKFTPIITFVVLLAGCATTAVYTDMKQDVNFAQFTTYAWLPADMDAKTGSLYSNEILQQKIMNEVNEEMNRRGFTINSQDPDMLVHIKAIMEEKKEVEPVYNTYDYYNPGFRMGTWYDYYYTGYTNVQRVHGYEMDTFSYTKGVIVVDMIDNRNPENTSLVWRGWVEDRIYPNTIMEEVEVYIEKLFNRFPVNPDRQTSSRK